MKFYILLALVALCTALPKDALELGKTTQREGRNVFANFLTTIGIVTVIPRECETSSTLLPKGVCSTESDCSSVQGAAVTACERVGYCCVVPTPCGRELKVKRGWLVNDDFPSARKAATQTNCEMRISRYNDKVRQVRLDFYRLSLNTGKDGRCDSDLFRVVRTVGTQEVDVSPPLCGENTGQHMVTEITEDGLTVKMRLDTRSRNNVQQQWRIYVTQLEEGETVPTNCLQYYDTQKEMIRSLNYDSSDKYISNMEYDICFKRTNEFEDEYNEGKSEEQQVTCTRSMLETDVQQTFLRKRRSFGSGRIASLAEARNDAFAPASSGVVSQIEKVVQQLKTIRSTAAAASNLGKIVEQANKLNKKGESVSMKDSVKSSPMKSVMKGNKINEMKASDNIFVLGNHEINNKNIPTVNETPVKKTKPVEEKLTGLTRQKVKETMENTPNKAEVVMNMKTPAKVDIPMKTVVLRQDPVNEDSKKDVTKINIKPVGDNMEDTNVELDPVMPENEDEIAVEEINREEELSSDAIIRSPGCGGSYLLVNSEYICGTVGKSQPIRPDIKEQFKNIDRISFRSIENPKTSLRFRFNMEVLCEPKARDPTPTATNEQVNQGGRFNIWQFLTGGLQ